MVPAPVFAGEPVELTLIPSGSGDDEFVLKARIVRPDGECRLQGQCVIRLPLRVKPWCCFNIDQFADPQPAGFGPRSPPLISPKRE